MRAASGRRRLAILMAALLLAVAGGIWWRFQATRPSPTVLGWPAALTLVAGDGIRGDAAHGRFSDPFAIAIDPRGVVYAADAGDDGRIRRVDPDGQASTLPGRFDTPSGLAIDAAGGVIVADTGGNAIRRIAPDGRVTTLAGDGTAGFQDGAAGQARFNGPIGVAVDAAGTIYVADSYNDRIRRLGTDGRVTTLAGGGVPGLADGRGAGAAFDTPCGIAVAPDSALLVADTGNDAIRRVGQDGQVTTLAHTSAESGANALAAPVGIAATWDGYVYAAAFHGRRIVELSPTGALRVLAGPGAPEAGNAALRFASPAGLAIDRSGALVVADPARYAVLKLVPRGASPAPALALRTAPPALVRAARFPWPVAPQDRGHEVVGDMGEVRGDYRGESRDHIHAGLDIHADVGERALAVADETVESPLPAFNIDDLAEGLRIDAMTYIHVRLGRTASGTAIDPARFQLVHDAAGRLTAVRVKRGARFHVGDALGTVNRMAHVHLELGPPGAQINPIVLRLPGLADHVAPHIDSVAIIDAAGRQLTERPGGRLLVPAGSGPLSIVVDAWDQVDGDAPRRRLGLYRAGFQLLRADDTPVPGFERPRIGLTFDRVPVERDAAKVIYAPASGDAVHSDQPTRFLYVVTNHLQNGIATTGGWQPTGLAPGDYVIRVIAADHAGNTALAGRDLPITLR